MAIKFDDFLSKKKEPAQVLDLSRQKITSKEEFKKYFDKIPEYKIKPEKVAPENIKIRDKDFGLTPSRREGRVPEYNYLDPTPPDMKTVHLADLCPVSIDWKMLTTLRPKTKQEEDMFSRLVQLGKLDLKHQQNLKRTKDSDWVRKTKNPRSSIVETRVLSCKECGEDFCDGSVCCKLMYENFFRIQPSLATGVVKDAGLEGVDDVEKGGRKHRRRGRTRTRKVRRRKPRKNSIFNRPASRGCSRDHSKRERHAAVVLAERSASQDRGKSPKRRPSITPRAKSAPRIHFKGLSSDEEKGAKKTGQGYTSSSGASHSEFSTHSESESPPRRVDFAEDSEQNLGKGPSKVRRPFLRHCTLSDSADWVDPYLRQQHTTRARETTSEGSDSSPSPERLQRLRPATIQLEFQPETAYGKEGKTPRSAPPVRSSTAFRKSNQRYREVRALTTGLSRIELAFADEEPSEPPSRVRRRQRLHRSARPKTSPIKPPSTCLQGKALFSKSAQQ